MNTCKHCGGTRFLASAKATVFVIVEDGRLRYMPQQTPKVLTEVVPQFCQKCGKTFKGDIDGGGCETGKGKDSKD